MVRPLAPATLVYGFRSADDPQVSPDGREVLATVVSADQRHQQVWSDLWLWDIDTGAGRRLTQASPEGGPSGKHNAGGRWSPDGRRVAFVSDRVEEAGIFVLDPHRGGEPRLLTRHRQGISDLAWSPDGTQIAYTTRFDPANPSEQERPKDAPPEVRVFRRIDYKQDGRGVVGDARLQVWVVDVESGQRRRITSEPYDHGFPQWSPDGRKIAALVARRSGMCSQLLVVDVASGAQTLIGPETGEVDTFAWSPAGDRILFTGDTRQTFQSDIFVWHVGSGEVQRLTDDLQVLPVGGAPGSGSPNQPVWLDEGQVLMHAVRAGGSGLYVVDCQSGALEPVVTWEALHAGFSVDAQRQFAVQSRSSPTEVGELYVTDVDTGEGRVLTRLNAEVLAAHPPARVERLEVERAGHRIEAWVFLPPCAEEGQRFPVVLDVHGGPNGFFGWGFTPIHQLLATHGFAVVAANPRGSSSYGRAFTQLVTEDWGGEDYFDLMAIVDAALERPWADRERVGISGYSYGGYMTAWTIGQTDRFKAAVCGAPCFDLESMYGTSDISYEFGVLQWGGAPHEAREWYERHSPSTYAHRAMTPTLIIHGEADERCPIGQGEQMFVALKLAGCEVEFARYAGADHGFRRSGHPAQREDCWARTLAWFQRFLA